MTQRVVLATRNPGKLRELAEILGEGPAAGAVELVLVSDFPDVQDVVEDGLTFEANATKKALHAARATGLPALADDSGLAVDALNGCPGIFSARWAGRHGDDAANNALLLAQLADVPDDARGAAFVCCAVLAMPDGRVVARHGEFRGMLAREPKGSHGFGYDPLLVLEDGRHSAELSPEEKNARSHRGQAFRALAPELASLLRPASGTRG